MKDSDPHKQLAAALGRVPSGLYVLTAQHGDAETGMLVSWVQQCSFAPPQVSVALKRGRDVNNWLAESVVFVLNILDDTQTDMISHFGRGFAASEPAFVDVELERSAGLPPVLTETLGYLACRVVTRYVVGDHDLLIAEVIGGHMLGEGQPMVHVRKSGLHY